MPKGKQSKIKSKTKAKSKQMRKNTHANEIAGVLLIALGIFIGVCVFLPADTGIIGGVLKNVTFGLFGLFAYPVPFAVAAVGVMTIIARNKKVNVGKILLIVLFVVSVFSLAQTFVIDKIDMGSGFFKFVQSSYTLGETVAGSGAVGCLLVYPVFLLIGKIGCIILFIALILVAVLVLANLSIKKMGKSVAQVSKTAVEKVRTNAEQRKKKRLYVEDLRKEDPEIDPFEQPEILGRKSFRKKKRNDFFGDDSAVDVNQKASELPMPEDDEPPLFDEEPVDDMQNTGGLTFETYENFDQSKSKAAGENADSADHHVVVSKKKRSKYKMPPLSLLAKPEEKSRTEGMEEQRRNALLIEETLANFGVAAKVVHIVKGPAVTRYELRPAPGVRVKRIKELENDLAMNLAAKSVKIEAPIPGKAAVGIEVPNMDVTFVHLRSMLIGEEFKKAPSPLTFALGKDISGKNYYVDITKMPHMLIAGETGSGKSVCINALITSILFKSSPDEVKMILIDPKVVELSVFKTIPHLLVPVVTDPKKAASALNWAVSEMSSRYKLFAEVGARNIARFNELAEQEGEDSLPRIVVIVDELAELMMAQKREVEDSICRIAQLGRAAGIHLVVATQRPSVDVITGVIKANISSRIAFKVNSGVDSRTILDKNGAEKLLRNGDMLYHPSGAPKEVRLQGCYVGDDDIERVTDYISTDEQFDEEVEKDIS
ncbi:MAG: DNA translocase FtsK, partial [Clostridia bacterium]|nr:DNA translocase FtsK [Clostridia bacterium]